LTGKSNARRYHIENVKAALIAPGEWVLVRNGDFVYIPLPGELSAKRKFVAPDQRNGSH